MQSVTKQTRNQILYQAEYRKLFLYSMKRKQSYIL
jgi:hypothetical protein